MKKGSPGRVLDYPLASFIPTQEMLTAWGPADDRITDPAQVPGPCRYWYFASDQGDLDVMVEYHEAKGFAQLYAEPQEPRRALALLGVAPSAVEGISPRHPK